MCSSRPASGRRAGSARAVTPMPARSTGPAPPAGCTGCCRASAKTANASAPIAPAASATSPAPAAGTRAGTTTAGSAAAAFSPTGSPSNSTTAPGGSVPSWWPSSTGSWRWTGQESASCGSPNRTCHPSFTPSPTARSRSPTTACPACPHRSRWRMSGICSLPQECCRRLTDSWCCSSSGSPGGWSS